VHHTNRQIDRKALQQNQLTCNSCATIDNNRPKLSSTVPPTGHDQQRQDQNLAKINGTDSSTKANNRLSINGELLRYVLRDVKQLKNVVTRQIETGDHREKRHLANANGTPRCKSKSLSDDVVESRLHTAQHFGDYENPGSLSTANDGKCV